MVPTDTKEEVGVISKSAQIGADVLRWRREQLVQAHFPLPLAARLAKDSRYDLHALIELVERGCEPELAVRILTPLDDRPAA